MRTDRFSAPCPPDVLLAAYEVEPDVGRARGLTAAHRVADLTVLDGYLLVAGDGSAQACAGGRASGELLIIDPTAVRGAAVGGTAVPAAPQRISLRSRPAAVTAVVTDVGRRVFVLADGGGEIVPIDLRRDAHLVRAGAGIVAEVVGEIVGEIVVEPATAPGRRPGPRSGGVRAAPNVAAHSSLGRVYVSEPDARRIAVIDAHRLTALPEEVIELPAGPVSAIPR